MSKPIEIVVVVVVIVVVGFVQKMLGKKEILVRKFWIQKNFRKENFLSKDTKKCVPKKCRNKIFWSKINKLGLSGAKLRAV